MNAPLRYCWLLLACSTLACHSAAVAPPGTTASPSVAPIASAGRAPQRLMLSDNWSSTVTVVREDSIILSLPDGSKQLERRGRTARFRMMLGPGSALSVQLDSLTFNPAVPIQDGSVGTMWTGRLDAQGRISSLLQTRHNAMTDELQQTITAMLPRVPRAGVVPGMTWRDTTEGALRIDVYKADEQRTSLWSVGEQVNRNPLILLPVSVQESFEQLGKGMVLQRQTTMSAQGTRRGTWFLTLVGQVNNAVLVDSVAKLVTITGTRDPLPTMEFTRTTIRYR